MILVPMDAPGVTIVRPLTVFGFDDSPHGHAEVLFEDVRVPKENLLLGEGRGFEIAQGRLGPGRIHHMQRAIGMAERALSALIERATQRKGNSQKTLTQTPLKTNNSLNNKLAFGKYLAEQGTVLKDIADSRIEIDSARLLVLRAAQKIDLHGAKGARAEIAEIKVLIPNVALRVIDRAIQVHGGAGVSQDFFLARAYAGMRTLRLADGPDEVHRITVAKMEIEKHIRAKAKAQAKL